MVPRREAPRSLSVLHCLLSSRPSPLCPDSPGWRRVSWALTPGTDPRPRPRPQPPPLPPRTRSIALRQPGPPPAPSWLQHHLRDLGEGPGAAGARRGGAGARRGGAGRGSAGSGGLLSRFPCRVSGPGHYLSLTLLSSLTPNLRTFWVLDLHLQALVSFTECFVHISLFCFISLSELTPQSADCFAFFTYSVFFIFFFA